MIFRCARDLSAIRFPRWSSLINAEGSKRTAPSCERGKPHPFRMKLRRKMARVVRRRAEIGAPPPSPESICPLCARPIPPGARASRHHLTPRLKGGARLGTVLLHQICHSAIHARFSEAELARGLNQLDALRTAPALADFLAWIRDKPAGFHAPTRMMAARTGPRRNRT